MNNKQIQFTTAMPTMKKSLMALAVAGTMAMSGGAYAASAVVTAATGVATETGAVATITTGLDTITFSGGTTPSFTSNVISGISGTALLLSVVDVSGDATVTLGDLFLGDVNGAEAISLASGDDAANTLNIGTVTGKGILNIIGNTGSDEFGITVVTGGDIGTSAQSIAAINITGGNAAVEDQALTVNHDVFATAIVLTGTASDQSAAMTVNTGATVTGDINLDTTDTEGDNAVLTLAGGNVIGDIVVVDTGETQGSVIVTGDSTVTGDIGVGTTVDADDIALLTVASGQTLTLTGIYNVKDTNLTGTLKLAGTVAQTVTGVIDGGVITVANTRSGATTAGVTFGNLIGGSTDVTALNLNATSMTTFNALSIFGTITSTGAGSVVFADGVTVSGNTNFTGAVTTNGDGDITLNGATNTFNSTVTATTEDIFSGADGTNSTTTFKKAVNLAATGSISIGAAGGSTNDTNIVTFNAAGGAYTVTGVIKGLDSDDINTVNFEGGTSGAVKIITTATAMGTLIDTINVGSYTTLKANEVLKATNTTLNSNSTVVTGAAKTHVTDIDGATAGVGTLDIDHATTLTGSVGKTLKIATIDIADGVSLIVAPGATGGVVDATTIVINEAGDDQGLALTVSGTADDTLTVKSAITSGAGTSANGAGLVTVTNSLGTVIFESDLGTNEKRIGNLEIGAAADTSVANVVNVKGNLFVDKIVIDGSANGTTAKTLSLLGTSATVSGKIDGFADADGQVVVGDGTLLSNVTFSDLIGGTQDIGLFKVSDKATANISKNVLTEATADSKFGLDVDGTLNLTSIAGTTLAIAEALGDIDIDGVIKVAGAEHTTVTAAVDLFIDGTLTTLLTGTAKTLTLAGANKIGLTSDTTINAGNQIITTGATTFGAAGRVNRINIKAGADFNPDTAAVIDATGDLVAVAGKLNIALASDTGLIANGATITVIEGTNASNAFATKVTDGTVVFVDSAIIDLQDNTSTTTDLMMKVVYKTSADGVTGQNSTAIVSALTAATNANNNTEWAAVANLTSTQTENAAEQLQPDMGAANGAALASISGANTVIAGRQANTKVAFNTQGKQSGVSTGDASNDAVVWAQIFGSTATQDKVGTIDGYDADSSGLALGWETEKSGDLLGLSVSYSAVDVDGKSATASKTDATSTQAAVYGTYGKATDWMVGYALGSNDTSRTINFGGLNSTAKGSYDSDIFSSKIGHTFDASGSFTPKADLAWTHIMNGSYTETGAGNLGLVVGSSTNDIVTARMGVEFAQHNESNGAVTIPRFSVMAGYDLVNDGAESSVSYIGGGTAFTTKAAAPEKVSLDLGFGVDHVSDDSTVSVDFNANLRDAYDSMTGSITLKSKF